MVKEQKKYAIIGDGSASLFTLIELEQKVLRGFFCGSEPPEVHIFAKNSEAEYGRGVAFGKTATDPHNIYRLTEVSRFLGPNPQQKRETLYNEGKRVTDFMSREEYGRSLSKKYEGVKKRLSDSGVKLVFHEHSEATSAQLDLHDKWLIGTKDGQSYGGFDYNFIAVGDISSKKFQVENAPSNYLPTNYDMERLIQIRRESQNNPNMKVVSLGSLSSAVDLANLLYAENDELGPPFKGELTLVSPSGNIPYRSTDYMDQSTSYYELLDSAPVHLKPNSYSIKQIFGRLYNEFENAKGSDYIVPGAFLRQFKKPCVVENHRNTEQEIRMGLMENLNYHHVAAQIPWIKLYEATKIEDREDFLKYLDKFIRYSNQNFVIPPVFRRFAALVLSGKVKVRQGNIDPQSFAGLPDGVPLRVVTKDGQEIFADYVINTSNGAAPIKEQIKDVPIFKNLGDQGWIKVNKMAAGFDVVGSANNSLYVVGNQGRKYPWYAGQETNGDMIKNAVAEVRNGQNEALIFLGDYVNSDNNEQNFDNNNQNEKDPFSNDEKASNNGGKTEDGRKDSVKAVIRGNRKLQDRLNYALPEITEGIVKVLDRRQNNR